VVKYLGIPMRWTEIFQTILREFNEDAASFYGDRLISLVVFGSVGRGTMRADSDIVVLLIMDPLPKGRLKRMAEFEVVESRMSPVLDQACRDGVNTRFSPVIKTAEEVRAGSPLFLDMVDDAKILFDRGDFFRSEMNALRQRLARLGAKRIWRGNAWYWDLKPDYVCGEEFQI
jgi:predicted nucleotidyltransferase